MTTITGIKDIFRAEITISPEQLQDSFFDLRKHCESTLDRAAKSQSAIALPGENFEIRAMKPMELEPGYFMFRFDARKRYLRPLP
jgi:hypothetical protein